MTNSKKMKRKKFYRTVSGKVRITTQVKKAKKMTCRICGSTLQGVPHGKNKAQLARQSKTQKRPSAMFGGQLCSSCRRNVLDEAILVKQNSKNIQNVGLEVKEFVRQATEKLK